MSERLLSDEELAKNTLKSDIEDILDGLRDWEDVWIANKAPTGFELSPSEALDKMFGLINSQKQAWADYVIGEDDKHDNGQKMVNDPSTCMDCSNPDERFARNTLRAEQRERNKL